MPSEALLIEDQAAGLTGFDYFRDFGRRVTRLQKQLRNLLMELKSAGKRIAAYGAAAKGTILLNSSGIGSDVIDFVADRSPYKQGKLMPGVKIAISPPERIMEEMPDYVLHSGVECQGRDHQAGSRLSRARRQIHRPDPASGGAWRGESRRGIQRHTLQYDPRLVMRLPGEGEHQLAPNGPCGLKGLSEPLDELPQEIEGGQHG